MIPRLRLTIAGAELVMDRMIGNRVTVSARAPIGSAEELPTTLAQLAAMPEFRGWHLGVEVCLDEPWIQCRRLGDLPAVSGPVLAALVSAQAGRYFRRRNGPLVTNARWASGGSPSLRPRREVALAVAAPESLIDAIRTGMAMAGMPMRCIRPAAMEFHRSRLVAATESAKRRALHQRATWFVAVAAVGSWLAAGAVWSARLEFEGRHIQERRAELSAAVRALQEVRSLTRKGEEMVGAVRQVEHARGVALGQLIGIARALPDSAWLTSVELAGAGTGRLSGVAPSALEVMARLERGAGMRGLQLEGAAVPEMSGGTRRERFTIRFGQAGGS